VEKYSATPLPTVKTMSRSEMVRQASKPESGMSRWMSKMVWLFCAASARPSA
jgi:hypothetical protein